MYKIVPSEEGTTTEQALEAFNKEYIPVGSIADRLNEFEDQQKKVFGKVAGSIDSKLNKEAKEFGLTLEGKTTENVDLIITTFKARISELESKYNDALSNPETKAEIEALNQKLSDRETLIKKLQGDYETTLLAKTEIEQNYTAKEKQLIVSAKLESAKNQFILIEDQNTRDACQLDLMNHKFEIDEAGNEIVRDQSGKIIVSTQNAGGYADYKEVLNSIYTRRNAHRKIQGIGEVKPIGITESTNVLSGRVLPKR
jgi:hypothetical protein